MFERFTEKAIKSVMLAQEEARRLGHNFVGTEQILLGLIGEANGCAGKALKHHGVTLKIARVETEKIIGRGSGFTAPTIPITPRAKRVLELAWDEARILGHNFIGTEHLLLGLIREGEGVAARVLENCGVGLDELKATVMTYITTMGSMPADTPANTGEVLSKIGVEVVTAFEAQIKDLKESLEYQTTVAVSYREKCDKLEAEVGDIKTEFGKLKGMAENLVATAEKLAETNAFLFRVLNLVLEIAEEKKS